MAIAAIVVAVVVVVGVLLAVLAIAIYRRRRLNSTNIDPQMYVLTS